MSRGYFHLFTGLLRVISRFRTVQCDLGSLGEYDQAYFVLVFFLGSGSTLDIDSSTYTEYIIRYQVLFHSIS